MRNILVTLVVLMAAGSLSAQTYTNVPVSIPQPFVQGQYPQCVTAYTDSTGVMTQVAFTQNDVKNRWPDSSLKFAIISFIVPSYTVGSTLRVQMDQQACPTQTPLTSAQMLATAYNFDAQIQVNNGANSHAISARAILNQFNLANSGGPCTDPGTDPDGSTSLCTYWLQGPVVTAVKLEDRSGRTYDVNTDGLTGNPLHPIFEAWFYPQGNQVQVGYTLENTWASTTAANSARDQTFSLVLTAGNTSPVTLASNWGAGAQNFQTRTTFHRTFCASGAQAGQQYNCYPTGFYLDHNYPYIAQTKFMPNWDPNLVLNPTYVTAQVTAWNATATNKTLAGSAAGVGFSPGTNTCGGSNSGTNGDGCFGDINSGGAAYFHGPLTTEAIICLITSDPIECPTVMLGNADVRYEVPYFYREADQPAGFGGFFDAPRNTVTTKGRVISINARTQVNLQSAANQTCNTNHAADWINFGGSGEDLGAFNNGTGMSHWPNVGLVAYLFTGQYAYYEEQILQSAYSLGAAGDYSSINGRACTATTGNTALRMGAAGYWMSDQERGADWNGRENALGAFLAVDGSPEKAYLTDKLMANLAVWEGAHNIPCDIPGTGVFQPYCGGSGITTAWSYGNTVRILNPNQGGGALGTHGGGLGSWVLGPASGNAGYSREFALCNGTLGVSVVNTNGTAVTWVSGSQFTGSGFTLSNGSSINITGVTYTVQSINSGTSMTLTTSAGVQTGAAFGPVAVGVPTIGGFAVCPTTQTPNPALWANSNFQNSYSAVTIGWINDLGFCPQTGGVCAMQQLVANHFINEALNPASTPYHLGDYVYPTSDNSGNVLTNWGTGTGGNMTYYTFQPTGWQGCPSSTTGSTDEWYTAEDMSAMSYFTNLTETASGNNYSGAAAFNLIRSGSGIASCLNYFSSTGISGFGSPKWDIVPRGNVAFSSGAPPPTQVANPTFSPVAGTYNSAQSVTISTSTSGATICYTVDGSTPTGNGAGTCTHGTSGTAGSSTALLTVSVSETVKAIGTKSGDSDSGLNQAAYIISAGSPVVSFSPTSLSLGNISLSQASLPATLTLTNVGNATLSWTSVSVTNPAMTNFAVVGGTCPLVGSLVAGLSCTFSISVTSTTSGIQAGLFTLFDNSTGNPHTVPLSVTVIGTPAGQVFATNLAGCTQVAPLTTTWCFTQDGHIYYSTCTPVSCTAFRGYYLVVQGLAQ